MAQQAVADLIAIVGADGDPAQRVVVAFEEVDELFDVAEGRADQRFVGAVDDCHRLELSMESAMGGAPLLRELAPERRIAPERATLLR